MFRAILPLAAIATVAWAQSPSPPPSEQPTTYLGVLVSAVPEVLYEHVPAVPRHRGVVVTHVLPDSPAVRADLKRHDILLAYNDTPIEDCEHFSRLIRADKPDQKVRLSLLRGGRPTHVDAVLGRGPALTVAQNPAPSDKGTAKPDGPGKVSVHATPLQDNKMSVTIEYYDDGKLRRVTRSGTSADIDREVHKLPPRVQDLARAALSRIRVLELQK
jgi:hypothetical protein